MIEMKCLKKTGQIESIIIIQSSYNYREKFMTACKENNIAYIKSLVKRGKIIMNRFSNFK